MLNIVAMISVVVGMFAPFMDIYYCRVEHSLMPRSPYTPREKGSGQKGHTSFLPIQQIVRDKSDFRNIVT